VTFLCINGMQHTWRPTGRVWAMWYATSTKASSMPTNAAMTREEVCSVCGAVRPAPANPEAKRYTAMEVAP
jgi:hypothetical protein